MTQIEREAAQVKELGDRIGYGHMMHLASALWRKMLVEKGWPASGATVPTSLHAIKQPNKKYAETSMAQYDEIVKPL
ncbi:hypothetical protein FVR03_01155 [Pontibacter qinzhouensis]|uniref:Uncharacterized protein n=1 Tax=Pontibacter qinzhouensis TaxID=2603253 RepID=A0A5C8KDR0_9BACT|nr:hypothetical protein [Pontibacter qinzhouensis]TXK52351.1 hypothetical protein FVR03_01155 [Pontibacter qinzhouensis]